MRSILSMVLLLGMTLAGMAGAADGGASATSSPPTATTPGQNGAPSSQGRQQSQGQSQDEASGSRQYAPGNTGQNRQHDTRLEAEDQSSADADVELTRNIRRALTDDPTLSVNAHNVKIITAAGNVTLRGPVNSEAERRKVEAIAKQAAGGRPVVNELEVGKR